MWADEDLVVNCALPGAAYEVPCWASVDKVAEPLPEVVLVGQKRPLHGWHVGVIPGLHRCLRH
eukprot:4127270-Prorocentrum_lima.AAC.1